MVKGVRVSTVAGGGASKGRGEGREGMEGARDSTG